MAAAGSLAPLRADVEVWDRRGRGRGRLVRTRCLCQSKVASRCHVRFDGIRPQKSLRIVELNSEIGNLGQDRMPRITVKGIGSRAFAAGAEQSLPIDHQDSSSWNDQASQDFVQPDASAVTDSRMRATDTP